MSGQKLAFWSVFIPTPRPLSPVMLVLHGETDLGRRHWVDGRQCPQRPGCLLPLPEVTPTCKQSVNVHVLT